VDHLLLDRVAWQPARALEAAAAAAAMTLRPLALVVRAMSAL